MVMKTLKTYEEYREGVADIMKNWNSIRPPSHHTEDYFKDYFIESDKELKPGDFVKTVTVDTIFDKHLKRYHRVLYGIWDGKSVQTFSKIDYIVRKPEWVKKVELKVELPEFLKAFWEYAKKELK